MGIGHWNVKRQYLAETVSDTSATKNFSTYNFELFGFEVPSPVSAESLERLSFFFLPFYLSPFTGVPCLPNFFVRLLLIRKKIRYPLL